MKNKCTNTTSINASDLDSKLNVGDPNVEQNGQTNDVPIDSDTAGRACNTLEKMLLHLDSLCDGATTGDGQGFNKEDSAILRPRAEKLIETGVLEDRKDTLNRLKKYKNTQLEPAGFDYGEMAKQEKKGAKPKSFQKSKVEIKVDPVIKEKALKLLKEGDLIRARREYIAKTLYGNEHAINALTYICNSAYLGQRYVIHADIIGESQAGKSTVTVKSLDLTAPEDIFSFSEMSPKYVYYKSKGEDFTNKIIYIDDCRDEHVPILKTMRNDSDGGLSHGTVIDGEAVDLVIAGRPAVIASSVKPLRDLEGQVANRSFLITIEKQSKDLEKKIHSKIRQNIGKGAMSPPSEQDEEKQILQEASRILRDEGLKDIVAPFDVEEPEGSGNRATAQFERLIIISAFIHQFQRPFLHVGDKKLVLAVYKDLENALDIWHGLGLAHSLKIAPTGLKLLKLLPTDTPNSEDGLNAKNVMTAQKLHGLTEIPERTISAHLEDLYEAGVASRCKIKAQGSPFAYWTDSELSNLVHAEKPTAIGIEDHLSRIQQESGLPKYGPKYASDCLETSIYSFFEGLNKEKEKISVKLELSSNEDSNSSPVEFYLGIWLAEIEKEVLHTEESSKELLPKSINEALASDYPAIELERDELEKDDSGCRGRSIWDEVVRFEEDVEVAF
jgi:hypothetical protein